jgi:hypothetical protein
MPEWIFNTIITNYRYAWKFTSPLISDVSSMIALIRFVQ